MDTGGVMLEVVRLKMVKRLLSGDTVRIVANVKGYELKPTKKRSIIN